jgi:hypothetical protein
VVIVAAVAAYYFYRIIVPSNEHQLGETPTDILKRNGYLEIRPASNLVGPGMLVTIDDKTPDFVMMHATCNMDLNEVVGLWQSSPTVDTQIANQLEGEFKIGVAMLKKIGINVNANAVDEVNLKFTNTKVIALTDESRFSLRSKYLKDSCLDTVRSMILQAGDGKTCVTQPISAMQADIEYRIKFSTSASADEQEKILRDINLKATIGGREDAKGLVIGKSLFVGLKLDAYCIVPNDGHSGGKSVADLPETGG